MSSYDFYVELGGESKKDLNALLNEVEALVNGNHRSCSIPDIATRIRLLAGVAVNASIALENERDQEKVKNYTVSGDRKAGGGYKSLVHRKNNPEESPYAKDLIQTNFEVMQGLGLFSDVRDLYYLPPGSWFLQFTFALAKPWMSKDDDPFYVAESVNPVRKDKVFKVPMMSAASWKGLLRWTAMHIRLAQKKDSLKPEQFARERFVQTLLFGDEKGEEPGQTKDFAAYLDGLKPEARAEYEHLLRNYYHVKSDEPLPHHSGRLTFYPTFFNLIDVEVINPHSRKTKAGTHPIYLECVPAGATGTFSLLYVPFDLIGQKEEDEIKQQALADLQLVAEGLQAMFLTYGFSAKRSSGYGTAKDEIEGKVKTRACEKPLTKLSQLAQEVKDVTF